MSCACSRLGAQLARGSGHFESGMEKNNSNGNASRALIPNEFRAFRIRLKRCKNLVNPLRVAILRLSFCCPRRNEHGMAVHRNILPAACQNDPKIFRSQPFPMIFSRRRVDLIETLPEIQLSGPLVGYSQDADSLLAQENQELVEIFTAHCHQLHKSEWVLKRVSSHSPVLQGNRLQCAVCNPPGEI